MNAAHLRHIHRLAPLVALVAAITCGLAASPGKKKALATEELFSSTNLLHLELEISPEAMARLRKTEGFFGQQTNREKVQVTVREGNRTYDHVSLQLKGAAGSFRAIDDKPAFTLNFEKFVDGQHFHGLQKLSLNNSVQDATYASEQIARELFLKAGVPVPRATQVRVSLNGKPLGPYLLVEGWDRQFLKRHFQDASGHLYDGGFVKDISDPLALNSGTNPDKQPQREALGQAAKESNLGQRLARFESLLDIDRFLSFVALDVILWNWDGYALNRNNWRLYHEPGRNKLVFMPHGLDQLFWRPEASVLPGMQGLIAKTALEIPELRSRYLQRIDAIRKQVLDVPTLTNRILAISSRVRPTLAAMSPKEASQHDDAVQTLCAALAARSASLERQLAQPIVPIAFNEQGVAPVRDWKPNPTFGYPALSITNPTPERRELAFAAPRGSSIGGWRSTLWLERGRYVLEGRVRTSEIVGDPGDPRAGAGFRTRQTRPENYLTGSTDWQWIRREFEINDGLTEVDLLCEVRAGSGAATFDLESMQLKRAPSKP